MNAQPLPAEQAEAAVKAARELTLHVPHDAPVPPKAPALTWLDYAIVSAVVIPTLLYVALAVWAAWPLFVDAVR